MSRHSCLTGDRIFRKKYHSIRCSAFADYKNNRVDKISSNKKKKNLVNLFTIGTCEI